MDTGMEPEKQSTQCISYSRETKRLTDIGARSWEKNGENWATLAKWAAWPPAARVFTSLHSMSPPYDKVGTEDAITM